MIKAVQFRHAGQGLHDITSHVASLVRGTREGLCTIFLRHTSAAC
jgi:thiamine phosphate synthase YjbQ (UPF0047 family)